MSESRERRSLIPGVLLLAGAAATLFLARSCSLHEGLMPAGKRGAPRELGFETREGKAWRLSGERGHVVAVNLWATWCGPCRAEVPVLIGLQADLASSGFRVVGISLDTSANREELVDRFRATYHVNYPLGFPPTLSQMQAGLDAIPTTLLFDREGRAAKVYVGEAKERELRADVASLLHEDAAPAPRSER